MTRASVIFDHGRTFVEVETAPQHFERRAVTLGPSDGCNVEVLSELSADPRIERGANEQAAH